VGDCGTAEIVRELDGGRVGASPACGGIECTFRGREVVWCTLVVPHDDGNVDEIGTRTIGRKLIMCGVDVRCVAIIVGVPWECQRRFGRIVNARCRRE